MNEKRPGNCAESQVLVPFYVNRRARRRHSQIGHGKVDCLAKPRERPPWQAINGVEAGIHRFVVRARITGDHDAPKDRRHMRPKAGPSKGGHLTHCGHGHGALFEHFSLNRTTVRLAVVRLASGNLPSTRTLAMHQEHLKPTVRARSEGDALHNHRVARARPGWELRHPRQGILNNLQGVRRRPQRTRCLAPSGRAHQQRLSSHHRRGRAGARPRPTLPDSEDGTGPLGAPCQTSSKSYRLRRCASTSSRSLRTLHPKPECDGGTVDVSRSASVASGRVSDRVRVASDRSRERRPKNRGHDARVLAHIRMTSAAPAVGSLSIGT